MARHSALDILPAFRFHLVDVATTIAFPVFLPQAGFSEITAPEITADIEEIKEGNAIVKRKVITGASMSTMTLSRGVTFFDSDFWRWFSNAILGPEPSLLSHRVRRNLMLLQFMHIGASTTAGIAISAGATAFLGGVAGGAGGIAALGIAAGAVTLAGGMWRVPAKAWMLWNCLPSRWKSGTDFSANDTAVSIAELDIEPELVEEYSLTTTLGSLAGGVLG